jgi:triacylglycerol esterase/lipase EstA (alpha/beta hydrolase family)
MRRLAFVLATLVALCAAPPARAGAPAAVTYRPPVDAPVVDPFRPADPNWKSGNRGLEYATTPGTAVGASAAGEVVFAGPVADGLHVVVLHDDGLRTSYSFLQLVAVKRGDKVTQGQAVGTAGDRFHFGARAGDAYLDPALLFGGGPPQVHLVPDEQRRPQTEAKEREGLARMFAGWGSRAIAAGGAAFEWAIDRGVQEVADRIDEVRGLAILGHEGQPLNHMGRFAAAAWDWRKARETCTPESVPTPRLEERRVAVMVAGLGSKSDGDSIDAVDTAALGYAPSDIYRYSYLGGTREERPYAATDTDVDIHRSAKHLRQLLERVAAERPGVPIDIIAHSQGGIVARTALTDEVDGHDPRLPQVRSLVTLSTPHRGAPLATLATMAGHTKIGGQVEKALHKGFPDQVDPQSPAVKQLAEQSFFMLGLNMRPIPAGVNVTSIGAREDVIVPAGVTHLDGAQNVIVSAPGGPLEEHSAMPGAPETHREIALGLAGMAPTCQSFGDFVADAVVSDYIRMAEEAAAAGVWMSGRQADRGIKATTPTVPRRAN